MTTFVAACSARHHTIGTIARTSSCAVFYAPGILMNSHEHSIREAVRNRNIIFEADDFPCFLWEGETADMSNLKKGFLHGGILIQVSYFSFWIFLTLTNPTDRPMHFTWALCRSIWRGYWLRWLR